MKLKQKNIILTGASSGIGLALLHRLSDSGARVIAVARNAERIPDLGSGVIRHACDVSRAENIDALFDFALEKLGSVDIFIANAGFAYYEQLDDPDWDHIERIYQTNVFSGIYSAVKMKAINADRPYRVVVTASAMSFLSLPGYSLYSSTKAALHGFAKGYRAELKKGQLLQMVYPIGTRTEFFDRAGQDTPQPWPSQKSGQVAKAIIRALGGNRTSIFPSRLFWGLNVANRLLPFIHPLIAWVEELKFRQWLKNRPPACSGGQPV